MLDLSAFAWTAELTILIVLFIASLSAHCAAGKEYESLRKLGIKLPSRDKMSSWQFTKDFLPDRKRRFYQRLMIIGFVLLFSIPAIDGFFRK